MKFSPPLIKAVIIKRYKRFLADVSHPELGEFTVHCPNTGSMKNCWEPGWNVWLQKSDNLKRKYPFTWVLAENNQEELIGINSALANNLVVEGLEQKRINEFNNIDSIQSEVKYGSENSRIDILLTDKNKTKTYVEIKSVTLKNSSNSKDNCNNNITGLGSFPDAKTTRGQKHLRELTEIAENTDNKAVLFFLVQHTGIKAMTIAKDIDPLYAELLKTAIKKGVKVIVYSTKINETEIALEQSLPFLYF